MSARKPSAAQRAVLLATIERKSVSDLQREAPMTYGDIAAAVAACKAAGWIAEDGTVTPAGREAARRAP